MMILIKSTERMPCSRRTYLKIIEEPHFECVRLRRTHSKCELLLNFRIDTKGMRRTVEAELLRGAGG
jgi:hypothetical protein